MIAWYFVMGALALLVTLLLFGFVGCGAHLSAPDPGEYATKVESTQGLVAYWRLGESSATAVPSSGGAAKDGAKDPYPGDFPGDYSKLVPVSTANDQLHSPATLGEIILGKSPGLLEVPSQAYFPCIDTDGGYVQVPWHDELNPPQFTLEAWVSPIAGVDSKYFYCLAESTGPQGLGPKKTGWGLYLGPSDLTNPDPAGPLFWQVWMGDGTKLNRVAIAKPGFSQLRLTYLALTFDGSQNLQLWVYFPDTNMDINLLETSALDIPNPPIIFHRNDASPDGQGDFFIGTGSNLTSIPFSFDRLYPFKGKIQEVALYKTDLSAPNNTGVQTILATHELSGGNL
jgi:hypothetical protein